METFHFFFTSFNKQLPNIFFCNLTFVLYGVDHQQMCSLKKTKENLFTNFKNTQYLQFNSFFFSEEKEMDFAEQLESVAYVLCGDGTISYDKFCHIWYAKGVSKLFSYFSVWLIN